LTQGYQPVGKDFPVFLHPKTHEEYALARTERKAGQGYHGFSFYTHPTVSLEDDLKRRDFTVNAMAMDTKGKIYDPYHGQEDLRHRVFRHVSKAFSEDPLRLLRLARFMARFPEFTIAPETVSACKAIVASGELQHLSKERIYQEITKAFEAIAPERFFETLIQVDAWETFFGDLQWTKLQYTWEMLSPPQGKEALYYWSIIALHMTDPQAFLKQMKAPKEVMQLTLHIRTISELVKHPAPTQAETLYNIMQQGDALRRPAAFLDALDVLTQIEDIEILTNIAWEALIAHIKTVDAQECLHSEDKQLIPACIRRMRIEALQTHLQKTL
ncbi:MAG: CCA-adding protein, partial [Alcaligenaceae bacterium]|nr:CCA-adding protein [Alcaligenaceae bacterium]